VCKSVGLDRLFRAPAEDRADDDEAASENGGERNNPSEQIEALARGGG
jgi:hypothetical protein